MELNRQIFRKINDIGKDYEYLNPIIYAFAEWTVFLLAIYLVISYFIGVKKGDLLKTKTMILGGISFVCTYLVCKILGKLHYNEQPFAELDNVNQLVFKEVDNSFPSDHTALFFSVIFAFYFCDKKYKWWLLVPFAMAFARVYVGVHYPYDVMAGGLTGVIISYVIVKLLNSQKHFVLLNEKLTEMFGKIMRINKQ